MNWNVNWWHLERFEAAVDVERRVITLSVAAVQRTGLIVVDYIVTGRRQRPLVRLWRHRSWRHQQRSWRHRVPAVRQRRVAIQRTVRTAVNIFFVCLLNKMLNQSIVGYVQSTFERVVLHLPMRFRFERGLGAGRGAPVTRWRTTAFVLLLLLLLLFLLLFSFFATAWFRLFHTKIPNCWLIEPEPVRLFTKNESFIWFDGFQIEWFCLLLWWFPLLTIFIDQSLPSLI